MSEKRKVEEECMNIAIKQNSILHGYKIDESRTAKGIEEERPDFILTGVILELVLNIFSRYFGKRI